MGSGWTRKQCQVTAVLPCRGGEKAVERSDTDQSRTSQGRCFH